MELTTKVDDRKNLKNCFYDKKINVVLDTNVIVSSIISQGGASRNILRLCLKGDVIPIIGVSLYAEYEDVLSRSDPFKSSPLSLEERDTLLDALISVSRLQKVHYRWRPNLPDEGDNHLIELAVASSADWIVTKNLRHLRKGELKFDPLRIGTAEDFLDGYYERIDYQSARRPT